MRRKRSSAAMTTSTHWQSLQPLLSAQLLLCWPKRDHRPDRSDTIAVTIQARSIQIDAKSGGDNSRGASLLEKGVNISRRRSKTALPLQVGASRHDSLTPRIDNRYPITVVAPIVKYKLVSVIAMCAHCHFDANETTARSADAIASQFSAKLGL